MGKGNKCFCTHFLKECKTNKKHLEKNNERLDARIHKLAMEKTLKDTEKSRLVNTEGKLDPLCPLLKIIGDRNKQQNVENWLHKVYHAGSGSDLHQSTAKELHMSGNSHLEFVKNENDISENLNTTNYGNQENLTHFVDKFDDDNYTDISNETECESGCGSIISFNTSSNENFIGNNVLLEKFQLERLIQNPDPNDYPITSNQSINSNQNIKTEMEKITKSLLMDKDGAIYNRNPDVITMMSCDHIHHSAKRSLRKFKNAITKPTTKPTMLTSGELYVNSFFMYDSKTYKKGVVNFQNSPAQFFNQTDAIDEHRKYSDFQDGCDKTIRSRNPLPVNLNEIDKYTRSNMFNEKPSTSTLV